jgi:mutator protein MutT
MTIGGNNSSIRKSRFTNERLIEVSAGLVFRNGLLLITKRKQSVHLGGLWEFPGGKIECDETSEDCLRRELREELGIEVEVHELIETIQHDYPEKSVRLKFFRCSLLRNEPAPIGCEEIAWSDAEDLANYEFPAADARLLEKLKANPNFWK